MRDYAFPVQGLGRFPASESAFVPWAPAVVRRTRGVGLSIVPPTPLMWSATPIKCPPGYDWVPAYPPSPTSPHVPGLTGSLLDWISKWAALYPASAASDGAFYFHLGTKSGPPLQYNPGFNSISVCAKKSSVVAHLTTGGPSAPPIEVLGASTPLVFPPALTTLTSSPQVVSGAAAAPSYTWLWVLLGLGAAGVAGYYLLD